MGKTLGIDHGSVRIGIALSDETNTIAFGKEIIPNTSSCIESIFNIVRKEGVSEIVIGYPLNLKGEKTQQTIEVEKFERELIQFFHSKNLGINIKRWDERFTSKIAQESLFHSGMKKKKRKDKSNLDIISAALLLQSYLDSSH